MNILLSLYDKTAAIIIRKRCLSKNVSDAESIDLLKKLVGLDVTETIVDMIDQGDG